MWRPLVGLLLLLVPASRAQQPFTPTIIAPGAAQPVKSHANSTLYSIAAAGYADPYYLLDLHGASRHDLGYAFGFLLANESITNLYALLDAVVPTRPEQAVVVAFAEWQWADYLGRYLPAEFEEEVRGLEDGIVAAGYPQHKNLWALGFVLSSFPGDIGTNIEWLLINEAKNGKPPPAWVSLSQRHNIDPRALFRRVRARLSGCSWFGVWGSRTDDGELYSGRNLDWEHNTGIAKYKLVTVFHPPAPALPHAAIGFAGLYGALTGMSRHLTVHEAGDDNQRETFEGVPWVLRLRLVMERATNLAEATQVWQATNNTMGMNLGIGSAADRKLLAMETCANYTASFYDNDPREANHIVNNVSIGAPLPEAVWRTNHAYDPVWLRTAVPPVPFKDSVTRYFLLHDTLQHYADAQAKIGPLQAVNLTAVPGAKGSSRRDAFLTCEGAVNGSNIISATFHPVQARMWLAYENTDAQGVHTPACCMPYVQLDMATWFGA